ncbi:MAG: hypothetical protein ABIK99_01750 [candidate division WOR-3 bacterium]
MAIVLSQSYLYLKKQTSPQYARQVLLENLLRNKGNVEKTAQKMQCSKNTIYLTLNKQKGNDLNDKPHIPKRPHPKTTKKEIVSIIIKERKQTGFGKRKLRHYLFNKKGLLIPESTIGKILKRERLIRSKRRVRREISTPGG